MLNIETKKYDWFIYYLYLYIFLLPWHFSKSQLSISSGILLLWAIIKFKAEILVKVKEYARFLPVTLFFAFLGYALLSTLWSDPISDGFEYFVNFYKYCFMFIPIFLVALDKELAIKSIKIIIISFGLYAIYSLLIYFGIIYSKEYGFQPSNPTGHLRYLIVCQYMLMGFFLGLFIAYYSKFKNEKIFFTIVGLLCFIGLFINNSRTAQLSFIVILFIMFILFFKNKIFNLKVISGMIIIIALIAYFLSQGNKLNRYISSYNETKKALEDNTYEGSFGIRLYLNKIGLEIFSENPFFGTGAKENRVILMQKIKDDPLYLKFSSNAGGDVLNHFHSEQMDTLTAYGLVGYGLLFFSVVFLIIKLRKNELMYYSSLVVFLSLFINSFANKTLSVKPLNYVYIIFFILFAIIAYHENKKIENKE